MASDFNSDKFGAISPELVIKSLTGCVVSTGKAALRVQIFNNVVTSAVSCASKEDFDINLRRALHMGYDGEVVLRVNKTDYLDGVGFGNCQTCANGTTVTDIVSSLFGEDENGVVYFNIANITT